MRTRCGYYTVARSRWLRQMCSVIQLYEEEEEGRGGAVYIFGKQTPTLYALCLFTPQQHRSSSLLEWVRRCLSVRALTGGGWLSPDWIQLLWKRSEGASQFALLNNLVEDDRAGQKQNGPFWKKAFLQHLVNVPKLQLDQTALNENLVSAFA